MIDYAALDAEEKPFALRLASWIKITLDPASVLDVGCGPGTYTYALIDEGVPTIGIDNDPRVNGKKYLVCDSLLHLHAYYIAPLVMCIEVAEHIEERKADKVVEALYKLVEQDGILMFSAAVPGQGGDGHINCQPKDYWKSRFCKLGMIHLHTLELDCITKMKQGYHMGWFINNLMCFGKV